MIKPPRQEAGQRFWRLSEHSCCLAASQIAYMNTEAKRLRVKPIEKSVSYLTETMTRKFHTIEIDDEPTLADVVTGQLYGQNGVCMSSDRMVIA